MTVFRKTARGFEEVPGNPVLLSLDGEVKAPLRTIMHESWTEEDRARFGIYTAEPEAAPEGKIVTSERVDDVDGKPVIVREYADTPPPPTPLERLAEIGLTPADLVALIDAEKARVR